MRSLMLLGVLAVTPACGLISSDVTDFPLSIKERTFSIDTASWMIDEASAHDALNANCSQAPAVCDAGAQAACTDCSGACNATSHTCDLTLQVAAIQMIDLATEQSELMGIDSEKAIHVTIDGATYVVDDNSLSVATPPLTIYVAPVSVVTPGANATAVGTVPSLPAMGKTSGETTIEYADGGREALTAAMKQWNTPFNLLVGASIVLTKDTPDPTGAATAKLHIKAHAGFD